MSKFSLSNILQMPRHLHEALSATDTVDYIVNG